ncbi:MAG: helix-turn-helix domain-containing protein [Bryobacterales bacterium]|nr:helix-turn-helix domain-containing protein [Bryobacterales bacterium]
MKLLTPAEVARMLRKSEHTLANWRAIGKGPPYANIGGIVYRERDVEEWLESLIRRTDDAPQKQERPVALPILRRQLRVHGQYGRGRLGGHRTQQDRRSQSGAQQSRRSRGGEQDSGTSEERASAGAQTPCETVQ